MTATDHRWIDNLLSRFAIPGVDAAGKGTSRRVSADGIYHLALASQLVDSTGLPIEAACRLAARLLAAPSSDPVVLFPSAEIRFDRAAFIRGVDARIADAIEAIAVPRRGRPPKGG